MRPVNPDKPVVLVTGASGLIGARLAREFAPWYTVVGLDIKPPPEGTPADWIETDLTDDEGTAAALAEVRRRHGPRLASVLHLAAYYDFSGEPSPLYDKLTVEGTGRLLRGLRSDFQTEQFVFSSSLLVMAPAAEVGERITEDSPTRAEWEYPRSKLDAEWVILTEHGGIPVVILRIAGVYDEDCDSIPIAQQVARIRERQFESHVFPGDTDHGQPFIHLDDLAECLLKTVELRGRLDAEEIFLVAEPDVMSYSELQDRLGELIHGREWKTFEIPKWIARTGAWVKIRFAQDGEPFIKPWMVDLADDHYAVDLTRARTKLGWEPKRRLRNTLPEMIHRLNADPRGWYERNQLPVPADV